jgi:hypothetical protein
MWSVAKRRQYYKQHKQNVSISRNQTEFLHYAEKVKFIHEQGTKSQKWGRSIALFFLQPRHQMEVGGQRHAPDALSPAKKQGTHCTGGWVGPRTGLDWCGKSRPTGIRSPDRPARSKLLWCKKCNCREISDLSVTASHSSWCSVCNCWVTIRHTARAQSWDRKIMIWCGENL